MNNIDWTEVAPKIIEDVADELMPDRESNKDDFRITYGRRGSFVVDTRKGQFFDFENHVGGGLFDMIKHLNGMNTKEAFYWLKDNGFLSDDYQPKHAAQRKHLTEHGTEPDNNKYLDYGKRLWNESESIGKSFDHPVRRWADHRNLFPAVLAFPDCIRFHSQRNYIIASMTTLRHWLSPTQSDGEAFQVISIDRTGRKFMKFDKGRNDKRVFGKMGGNGVIMLGHPEDRIVNVCEGLADGLSIYSRTSGMVLIAVTTITKLNKPNILTALSGRRVVIWADNDEAGQGAGITLANIMHRDGIVVDYVEPNKKYKDPAEAAVHDPFPDIDLREYRRRVDMFRGKHEPEREAFNLLYKLNRGV